MNVDSILKICQQHDLPVTDARLEEGMLQLVPADLAELPTAEALRLLAAELKNDEIRWVTLVIEGGP